MSSVKKKKVPPHSSPVTEDLPDPILAVEVTICSRDVSWMEVRGYEERSCVDIRRAGPQFVLSSFLDMVSLYATSFYQLAQRRLGYALP